MNKEQNQSFTKEEAKEYVYVMVSTLNQMVNYIPLRHFEFKEVVNITVTGGDYADNAKWDKNLANIYKDKSITNIEFSQTEITNITTIKNRLLKKR